MTPSSDSCGSQGIRTVLSPSGYIGPLQPGTSSTSYLPGSRSGHDISMMNAGLLSASSLDYDKQMPASDDLWPCLLVFRLAVGQQLNVSLIDFTAVARAELSVAVFQDDDDLDEQTRRLQQQEQQPQPAHLGRVLKESSNDRQVTNVTNDLIMSKARAQNPLLHLIVL